MSALETQVLIIGGGATGTALARDLALRGVPCLLVERDDLNAGASGRNHGLLHSGARYVSGDPAAAAECRDEGAILKRVAPQCIQDTGGFFVAVAGDDEGYVAAFPELCARCGIEARAVPVAEARAQEPSLSERTIAVYAVPDASIDPFKLSLETMAQAESLGARLLRRTALVGLEVSGGRVVGARLRHRLTGVETRVSARVVVNAAGAWAREVAALAGVDVPLLYSKGTLLVTHARLAHRVVNRLRRPSNADIVMPGGTVSIVGTTSITVPDLAVIRPTVPEVDLIVEESAAMLPALAHTRYIRAYAGVRPLVAASASPAADGRAVSRGFALLDHLRDGVANFVTITGGKLTTSRLMAERTADLVCEHLGVTTPCQTRTLPLAAAARCEWTEPGLAPKAWMRAHAPDDALLCECEMVSRSALDEIAGDLRADDRTLLADLALRSRLGKGACQGTFCAVRAVAHLYHRGALTADRGGRESIEFFRERWRGQHPVLWGEQLAQAELAEAIHCGLHGQELETRAEAEPRGVPAGRSDPSESGRVGG
jgi:glycerol-3-phosphate dehydrogenase